MDVIFDRNVTDNKALLSITFFREICQHKCAKIEKNLLLGFLGPPNTKLIYCNRNDDDTADNDFLNKIWPAHLLAAIA